MTAMDIREQVRSDVLDYQQLVSCLHRYAKPRDRIGRLLADGSLIRLRKGLYVFGERYRRAPLNREHLANLIYGPSYVSLDYALSHYGLIPERVENVTSVTTGAKRRFRTPFGDFTYQPLNPRRYAPGIRWAGEGDTRYLMASPEKALVDKVWADKHIGITNLKDFDAYLFQDLRLDESQAAALDLEELARICHAFASRKIDLLIRCLAQQRRIAA
jgi:predicted transcriptional regulator of viral defense system